MFSAVVMPPLIVSLAPPLIMVSPSRRVPRASSVLDFEDTRVDGGDAAVGVGASEGQGASVAFDHGACATDHAAQGLVSAAVVFKSATVGDGASVASASKASCPADLQRAGSDGRWRRCRCWLQRKSGCRLRF